jgi:putative ABC transport system permease protein
MFRNYLVTTLRNIERNWLYAAIGILGLAVAFTAAILIAQFVRNEFSYDRWVPGHQQVYEITDVTQNPGQPPRTLHAVQAEIAGKLRTTFSGATAVARLVIDRPVLRHRPGDPGAFEIAFAWADPDFFKIFPLPILAGDPNVALREPDAVALTRRMARKYFGRDLPIGDTLDVQIRGQHHPMRVVAVLKDLPSNTILISEIFASTRNAYARSAPFDAKPKLGALICQTFVRLAKGVKAQSLLDAVQRAGRPETAYYFSQVGGARFTFSIAPLDELHLSAPEAATSSGAKPTGDAATTYAIGVVGALIVLVAAINFVSLTTARSARRAVEVGVRKAAGARRGDLILQFMGEGLLQVALAAVIAMALAELGLPAFSAFIQRELTLDFLHDPWLLPGIGAVALSVGLLSAIYPALVLSSFHPAAVLKGGVIQTSGSMLARQALVVVQFAVLIGLMVTTATLYRQTQFALRMGMGGDHSDRIVEVSTPCKNAFPDEVRRLPGVKSASCGSMYALKPLTWTSMVPVQDGDGRLVNLDDVAVDFGLFQTLGVHPLAGRLFDRRYGRDSSAGKEGAAVIYPSVILNETAARRLGYASPSAAIGHMMLWRDPGQVAIAGGSPPRSPIVGIVPDMPATARAPARATFYFIQPALSGMLVVRLSGKDVPATLRAIERAWKATGNTDPISEVFLSRSMQTQYLDVIIQSVMIGICAVIAVLIACLGLFALSAYATERRTKEIGVRKVMEAATRDVMLLLLWQFTIPVLVASAVALPAGFLVTNWWLHGFAYHVDLPAWTFVLAAAAAVGIAWLTVSYQSFMVARAKPVGALRYE